MRVEPSRETHANEDALSHASATQSRETRDSPAACLTGADTDRSEEKSSPRSSALHPRTRSQLSCWDLWVGSARIQRTLLSARGCRRDLDADTPEPRVRCTNLCGSALDGLRRRSTLLHP